MKKILTIIVLALLVSTSYAQTNKNVVAKKPQTTVRKPQTAVRKPQTTTRKPVARNQTQTRKSPAATKPVPKKKSVMGLCPDDNHPHAIDLGLSSGVLWSCCNVGAELPEEYGGMYAWGEVKEKRKYQYSSYKYFSGPSDFPDRSYSYSNIYNIQNTDKDVAHVIWGKDWTMPSIASMEELIRECIYEYVTVDTLRGGKFTGPNGNAIFLPAAGMGLDEERRFVGDGHYSVGQSGITTPPDLPILMFRSDDCCFGGRAHDNRYWGFSVRPVIDNR